MVSNQLANIPRPPRGVSIAGKFIIWKNGIPVPAYVKPFTPQSVNKLLASSLQIEYEPLLNQDGTPLAGEEKHIGKTKLEVGVERLANTFSRGDQDAITFAFDRLLGKPKQSVESVTISGTYEDFLKACKPPTQEELQDANLEDVQDAQFESEDYSDLEGI
jgi:hypothetical protein